ATHRILARRPQPSARPFSLHSAIGQPVVNRAAGALTTILVVTLISSESGPAPITLRPADHIIIRSWLPGLCQVFSESLEPIICSGDFVAVKTPIAPRNRASYSSKQMTQWC